MAFENKWITERDMKKRQTPFWSERARAGKSQTRWSVDDEHDMYLMWLGHGADDDASKNTYLFYRQGQSYEVLIDLVGGEGYLPTDALRTPYALLSINEFGKARPPLYPGPSIAECVAVVAGLDEALQTFLTPPLIADPRIKRNAQSWSAGWQTAKLVNGRPLPAAYGYVNERISEADKEKYEINYWNKRTCCGNDDWTVNREQNIFLREKEHLRETEISTDLYFFFWSGYLFKVTIHPSVGGGNERASPRIMHYSLGSIYDLNSSKYEFPVELENRKTQLLSDLKIAFTACHDHGIFASSQNFIATFDF